MYTEQKNNKKLKTLYEQSLHIKSAIPHPLIMGVIRGESREISRVVENEEEGRVQGGREKEKEKEGGRGTDGEEEKERRGGREGEREKERGSSEGQRSSPEQF